jgi:site-specific recombinase XerC
VRLQSVELLRVFLEEPGIPTAVDAIERQHVEAFVTDQVNRWKPKTAQVRYGDIGQFFNWCLKKGECDVHPMARMKPPAVPEVPVPVSPDADLKPPFKACDGTTFEKRRDAAVLRVLNECGFRLGVLTGLMVYDVDFASSGGNLVRCWVDTAQRRQTSALIARSDGSRPAVRDGTHERRPTNALRSNAGGHGGAGESHHLLRRACQRSRDPLSPKPPTSGEMRGQ